MTERRVFCRRCCLFCRRVLCARTTAVLLIGVCALFQGRTIRAQQFVGILYNKLRSAWYELAQQARQAQHRNKIILEGNNERSECTI